MSEMPWSAAARSCSALPRIASSPPCTLGCSVLRRPSIISGKPVSSETSRTASPAALSAAAVPPVDTSSTPWPASAFANSTMPALSDTDRRARRIFMASPILSDLFQRPRYFGVAEGHAAKHDLQSVTWTCHVRVVDALLDRQVRTVADKAPARTVLERQLHHAGRGIRFAGDI